MNEHEEKTCQAERDYDFQREEELLTGHTADEQKDMSQCHDFFERVLRYASNDVLLVFKGMIIDELNARPEVPNPTLDAYFCNMKEQIADIQAGFDELKKRRSPF